MNTLKLNTTPKTPKVPSNVSFEKQEHEVSPNIQRLLDEWMKNGSEAIFEEDVPLPDILTSMAADDDEQIYDQYDCSVSLVDASPYVDRDAALTKGQRDYILQMPSTASANFAKLSEVSREHHTQALNIVANYEEDREGLKEVIKVLKSFADHGSAPVLPIAMLKKADNNSFSKIPTIETPSLEKQTDHSRLDLQGGITIQDDHGAVTWYGNSGEDAEIARKYNFIETAVKMMNESVIGDKVVILKLKTVKLYERWSGRDIIYKAYSDIAKELDGKEYGRLKHNAVFENCYKYVPSKEAIDKFRSNIFGIYDYPPMTSKDLSAFRSERQNLNDNKDPRTSFTVKNDGESTRIKWSVAIANMKTRFEGSYMAIGHSRTNNWQDSIHDMKWGEDRYDTQDYNGTDYLVSDVYLTADGSYAPDTSDFDQTSDWARQAALHNFYSQKLEKGELKAVLVKMHPAGASMKYDFLDYYQGMFISEPGQGTCRMHNMERILLISKTEFEGSYEVTDDLVSAVNDVYLQQATVANYIRKIVDVSGVPFFAANRSALDGLETDLYIHPAVDAMYRASREHQVTGSVDQMRNVISAEERKAVLKIVAAEKEQAMKMKQAKKRAKNTTTNGIKVLPKTKPVRGVNPKARANPLQKK